MKIKNCPHVNYKYYRRFKPLIRKEMNLLIIHNYLVAFTLLGSAFGIICGFCGDIELPKVFFVSIILSILGLFYTIYLELKLKKQIRKIIEEIKKEQKSQFR